MFKDFFKWHLRKKEIDIKERTVLYRAQEIWWCSIGANVGVEADGKSVLFERPVLVFRKFNKDMFWGLPLTSQIKEDKPFYFAFSLQSRSQTAVLSQMRVLSSKRLIRRLGKISDKQQQGLNAAVIRFLQQTDPLRGPRVPNGNSKNHVTKRR